MFRTNWIKIKYKIIAVISSGQLARMSPICNCTDAQRHESCWLWVRGNVKKKKQYICWHCPNWSGPPSLLPYFWQIYFWHIVDHVDLPPSPRIFDKNHKILGFKTLMFFLTLPLTFSIIPITFWGSGVQTERHRFPLNGFFLLRPSFKYL